MAVGLVPVHPVWKSFLSVLFVVALVVALVWLTDRFDETVQYLRTYTTSLHQRRLEAEDWRKADTRIQATLQTTGLSVYLDSLRDSAARLRQDVLFLGPERLYSLPKLPSGEGKVRCFIVMPFSLEWSDMSTAPCPVLAKPWPSSLCAETMCLPRPTFSLTSGKA